MNAVNRLQSLQVTDAMNKQVVTVSLNDTMDAASRLLRKSELSAAPVVDANGICVGILSTFDFMRRNATGTGKATDRVGDWMSSGVQAVAAHAPLLRAAQMMCIGHLHRLPVLDRAGRPVGVISTLDVVAAQLHALDEMEPGAGFPPAVGKPWR